MFGIVATEETGVDDDPANNAWEAESNDAPVEAGCSSPPAFPAIHPLATIGVLVRDKDWRTCLEQILFGGKKIIIRHQHRAPQPLRREIDQFSKVHKCSA